MARDLHPVFTTAVETPQGPLLCAVDETGTLLRIDFARAGLVEALAELERHGYEARPDAERTAPVRSQLEEYLARRRRSFDLPLAAAGSTFQQAVWRRLQEIPYGEVRSYGEIARAMGRPGASRAVGVANGSNPIPIVIPCHRVIGADGSLTGFGGGLEWKRFLLELEGAGLPGLAPGGAAAQLSLDLS